MDTSAKEGTNETTNLLSSTLSHSKLDMRLQSVFSLSKNQLRFKYSPTLTFILCRCFIIAAVIVYIAGVTCLAYFLNMLWLFFMMIVVVNLFCLLYCGNYILRAIIFPYSNFYIKQRLGKE